jgi:hypothetical protein
MKFLVHKEYTRESRAPKNYLLLQSRKQIKSTKFPEDKLGTWAKAQSRRDEGGFKKTDIDLTIFKEPKIPISPNTPH